MHTRTPSGVFVQTGATAGMVGYFFADEGESIIHSNGQLVIVDEE